MVYTNTPTSMSIVSSNQEQCLACQFYSEEYIWAFLHHSLDVRMQMITRVSLIRKWIQNVCTKLRIIYWIWPIQTHHTSMPTVSQDQRLACLFYSEEYICVCRHHALAIRIQMITKWIQRIGTKSMLIRWIWSVQTHPHLCLQSLS